MFAAVWEDIFVGAAEGKVVDVADKEAEARGTEEGGAEGLDPLLSGYSTFLKFALLVQ